MTSIASTQLALLHLLPFISSMLLVFRADPGDRPSGETGEEVAPESQSNSLDDSHGHVL